MQRTILFLSFLITACGGGAGSAETNGSIDGIPFDSVKTVFYGNAHIVLFDQDVDCLDVAFIDDNYVDGEDPTDGKQDFIAMQFIFKPANP